MFHELVKQAYKALDSVLEYEISDAEGFTETAGEPSFVMCDRLDAITDIVQMWEGRPTTLFFEDFDLITICGFEEHTEETEQTALGILGIELGDEITPDHITKLLEDFISMMNKNVEKFND